MTQATTTRAVPTVLVAECAEICTYLRSLLERVGFSVDSSLPDRSAETVLAASPGRFDVVITNRPERCLASGVPVIYIAALPDPELAGRCAATLRKPFFPADLLAAITAVLREHGQSGGSTAIRVPPQSETKGGKASKAAS